MRGWQSRTEQPGRTAVRVPAAGRGTPAHANVLALQRAAGNRAVSGAVTVQRHNSYEHQLLGDTKPADVAKAKVLDPTGSEAWEHLVEEEYQRVTFFTKGGAELDPREKFPQTRWLRLGTSKLWVSPGELSAFGDYLPNPEAIDTLPAATLVPIVQRMRQEIARSIYDRLRGGREGMKTEDAEAAKQERNRETRAVGATGGDKGPLPEEPQTIQDLDAASSSLGPNRQKGLMGRNACHFAPFSWERWSTHHYAARALALSAYKSGQHQESKLSMRASRDGMSEDERKAWVSNGYANHFLQDSFAAGHLINKTLVMQWFVEYLDRQSFGDRPHFGVPEEAKQMTTKAQPDIADRRAYHNTRLHTTAASDHGSHATNTDPQSTLERGDQVGRYAGSGVRPDGKSLRQRYDQYATFLNSAFINLSANDAHDHFNALGLTVLNKAGDKFFVYGDGTLLMQDEAAIGVTLKADSWTDEAIHDVLVSGQSAITVEQIFALFPSSVVVDGKTYPLEQWNDQVLKKLCDDKIFPGVVENASYAIVRAQAPRLIENPAGPGGGILTPQ